MTPVITALVPVYQGAPTIGAALESLYTQNVSGLNVLVLDDGSTDGSAEIVRAVAAKFPHVPTEVLRHPNMGLTATLNRGLAAASGIFVARLDADDLALPGRLRRQLDFLEAHPSVALVGTAATVWRGDHPSGRKIVNPELHESLTLRALFANPFVHSSVLVRTAALRAVGGYRQVQAAEDYDLWSRICRRYRVANLATVLTVYRDSAGGIARTQNSVSIENAVQISSDNLFETLRPVWDRSLCASLARLYYYRRGIRPCARVSPVRVRRMMNLAAMRIGGPRCTWSSEFRHVYRRLLYRLLAKCALSWLPQPSPPGVPHIA